MSRKSEVIIFQGVPGAHADLACRQAYPYYESKAVASFDEAVRAVENGDASLCLIPFENSHAGRVAEIHNLLPQTKLHIVGEYFLPVAHHLLAPKNASLKTIKTVYSHPQALMQCREHVHKLKLQSESFSNTAAAAKAVSEWNDPSKAALGSSLAAELYGLQILKPNMHDADDNTTLFIALAREPSDPDIADGMVLTSLFFSARNIPAALYKALGGFATNQVNLIKIESYIPSGKSKNAQFFVTFEGHPNSRNVQLAMEELGFFCKKVKVLGVYPAAKERFS